MKTKRNRIRYTDYSVLQMRIRSFAVPLLVSLLSLSIYYFTLFDNVKAYSEKKLINLSQQESVIHRSELEAISTQSSYYQATISSLELAEQEGGLQLDKTPNLKTTDTRVVAMRQFLQDYNSPMYPYAEVFVKEADKYGLDWRLVASISGVESAFGNIVPGGNSNNAWGWKGDPTKEWSEFPTWKEGITTVTARMALGYGIELTPFQIEPVYCPPCGRNPAHAWANGVTRFMNELEYYNKELK